jgi:hypothetical protein
MRCVSLICHPGLYSDVWCGKLHRDTEKKGCVTSLSVKDRKVKLHFCLTPGTMPSAYKSGTKDKSYPSAQSSSKHLRKYILPKGKHSTQKPPRSAPFYGYPSIRDFRAYCHCSPVKLFCRFCIIEIGFWRLAMLSPCPGCGALFPDFEGPTHRYIGASAGCWALFNWSVTARGPDATGMIAQSRIPGSPPDERQDRHLRRTVSG